MTVTRGEGVKKSEMFADVLYGSPLTAATSRRSRTADGLSGLTEKETERLGQKKGMKEDAN